MLPNGIIIRNNGTRVSKALRTMADTQQAAGSVFVEMVGGVRGVRTHWL